MNAAALGALIAKLAQAVGRDSPRAPGWYGTELAIEGGEYLLYGHDERGGRIPHVSSTSLDDFLYQVMCEVVHLTPTARCSDGVDLRRACFRERAELLGQLSPAWGARVAEEQRRALETRPFDDCWMLRRQLSCDLQIAGSDAAGADQAAEEHYPTPTASGRR